jgi:nitroreductase
MVDVLNDPSSGTIGLLLSRRSGSAKAMTTPGPDADQLRTILKAGMRAPDHGKLFPWRFVIFEGEARARIGRFFAECLKADEPDAGEVRLEIEEKRFLRAPVVVAVVSRVTPGIKIPEWEQQLSAGAVCENILVVTHALGFVASWITEWCAYDTRVAKHLGLADNERIAGFIYIGTSAVPLEERIRPEFDAVVTRY